VLSQEHGSADGADPRRQRDWLRNQGWGRDPLAAVALKLQAQAAEKLGDNAGAKGLWRNLLDRFPREPASADALYVLGREQRELRQQLLQRFPAHPAALAAAQERGSQGAPHLARWGPRWPGAAKAIRERCGETQPPLESSERAQLAAGLAQLGQVNPALQCLGDAPASAETQLALARALLRDPGAGSRRRRPPARPGPQRPHQSQRGRGRAGCSARGTAPPAWRRSGTCLKG
jgi:soluble lytic murein transglycosylase